MVGGLKIKLKNDIIAAAILLLAVFGWQFMCDNFLVDRSVLPSPKDILFALINIRKIIIPHFIQTLKEASIGLALSAILAIFVAMLTEVIPALRSILSPLMVMSQSIPTIVLAPLFVIWFGFGDLPKIIVVVMMCFFPIIMNLYAGMNAVDNEMVNTMKCMGAKKRHLVVLVKLPVATPYFISGLKIAASYSVVGAVIGEWLGGENGLGVYMMRTKQAYEIDNMFASVMLIVALSMIFFKLVSALKFFIPWMRGQNNES